MAGDIDIISLTEIARKQVKENIENVAGVGSIDLIGKRQREIHVIVDPMKLSALGLPIIQVKAAIMQQNIEVPGGNVENSKENYTLRILGRINNIEDFEDILKKNSLLSKDYRINQEL